MSIRSNFIANSIYNEKPINMASILWLLLICLSLAFPYTCVSDEQKNSVKQAGITVTDLNFLASNLGKEVVGTEITAPLSFNTQDYFPLQEQQWRYRPINTQLNPDQILARLEPYQPDGKNSALWRFDPGTGESELLTKDINGQLVQTGSENRQHRVVTYYDPPMPVLPVKLQPGISIKRQIKVQVYDMDESKQLQHNGELELQYQYLGAINLKFNNSQNQALIFKSTIHGKIGPAEIKSTLYRLFSNGKGMVASVEQREVSAYLIYRERMQMAQLIVDGSG
jgi:hypothetical protein